MLRVIPLVVLSVLGGCSLFGSERSSLDDARARWARADISNYDYTLTRSCFCPDGGQFRIEVRAGEVTTIQPLGPPKGPSEMYEGARLTIDDLFGILAQAIADDADEVMVTYDAGIGYPTSITIDYIRDAVDDEVSYRVADFEALD